MPMIKVSECVLKALLELLFRTNSCSVIKNEMRDVSGCDDDDYGCIKEHCPYHSVENFIKYLNDEWDEEHDYD